MRLTVLTDNNTRINKNLTGEPALSFYIETEDKKILFDCGYSDAFIKNASKLQINLLNLTDIVFSHVHNDHTSGLFYLKKLYQDILDFRLKFNIPRILTHTNIFTPIIEENVGNVSFPFEAEQMKELFQLGLSDEPVWITQQLCYTGKILHNNLYKGNYIDETSLAYVSSDGLVLIVGCCHAGLENIIEHAKKITGISKVKTIIGGFHFINKTEAELSNVTEYLHKQNISVLYPCHCTDLNSKIIMAKEFCICDVCTGDIFEF